VEYEFEVGGSIITCLKVVDNKCCVENFIRWNATTKCALDESILDE